MLTRMALAAASVAVVLSAATPAAAVEWRYSSWTPPTAPNNRLGTIPMFEQIKKDTNGTLTFQNFMGAQLFNALTTLKAVGDGAVDAGVVVPVFTPAELKYQNILADMQALMKDGWSSAGANNETLMLNCPECLADFDRIGTFTLGVYSSADYYMMCVDDISKIEDLRGKKLGGGSAMNARWGRMLDQSRIVMGPGDMLQGLQRRQVDCTIGPKEWLYSLSLKDVIKTVVDNQHFGPFPSVNLMTMNKNSWNKLSREHKQAIVKAIPGAVARVVTFYYADEKRGIEEARQKNVKFVSLPALEGVWANFVASEPAAIVDQAKSRGVADADKIVARHMETIKKWEGIIARIGKTEEALAKALWDEVYSKIRL